MIRCTLSDELERTGSEVDVACSRCHDVIFLEELAKTAKIQIIRCSGWDSNQAIPREFGDPQSDEYLNVLVICCRNFVDEGRIILKNINIQSWTDANYVLLALKGKNKLFCRSS